MNREKVNLAYNNALSMLQDKKANSATMRELLNLKAKVKNGRGLSAEFARYLDIAPQSLNQTFTGMEKRLNKLLSFQALLFDSDLLESYRILNTIQSLTVQESKALAKKLGIFPNKLKGKLSAIEREVERFNTFFIKLSEFVH